MGSLWKNEKEEQGKGDLVGQYESEGQAVLNRMLREALTKVRLVQSSGEILGKRFLGCHLVHSA